LVTVVSRELVDIQENALRQASDHLALVRSRVDAGDALRVDLVRAETEVERARQDLISAHLALDNARDALGTLTDTKGLPMPAEPPSLPPPPTHDQDEASLRTSVGARNDVRAGRAGLDLAERMLDVAWMQFVPTLSVGGQLNFLISDPPDLGSTDRVRWAALVTLTVPLYNQPRYADLDAKRALVHQASLRAEQAVTNAELEIRRARRDYDSALAACETATRQAALAREALALAETAYSNGASTSLDLTDAERTAKAAATNAAAQRLRSQMALLTLLSALGTDLMTLDPSTN
jgi:outer membrane protein TolC